MKLMEKILSQENLKIAIKKVKKNKGAPGVDKMTVQEIEEWFNQYQEEIIHKRMLNAKLNKKKNKENSQNKRKSLIKVNE